MPRRKPKHLYEPGQSGNPNGRPVGSINEINKEIKWAFTQLLKNQLPNLEEWLTRAAARDPLKAADLMLRVSERFLPSLSRTEITGADGQAFTPITINIPNLRIGEGASASIPLQSGNLGLISEGAPDWSSAIPVPKNALSEEISEGAPTESQPGHYEHLNSAVSGTDGHYEHLNSAVSDQGGPIDSAEAPSQELPASEEVLENSPIFAPEYNLPLRQEDQFDPAQVKTMYEDWKAKQSLTKP